MSLVLLPCPVCGIAAPRDRLSSHINRRHGWSAAMSDAWVARGAGAAQPQVALRFVCKLPERTGTVDLAPLVAGQAVNIGTLLNDLPQDGELWVEVVDVTLREGTAS